MASMQEIRTRINSVKDTMKITNAMYLIASSKLRKARSGRDAVEPYFDTLQATISDILDRTPDINDGLFEDRVFDIEDESSVRRCYILISSDKGLAGSYNHNVFKLVEEQLEGGGYKTIIPVGHMALNQFKDTDDVTIDREHIYPAAEPTILRARDISEYVIDKFMKAEFDEVYVVYTRMVNSMVFRPEIFKVLPLTKGMFNNASQLPERLQGLQEPVFSPSPIAVLRHIVPNYVKGLIYGAIVESYACEQSARMTAMDNATSNAKEMIAELSLIYNRARQAAITQEITEIVSGSQSAQ